MKGHEKKWSWPMCVSKRPNAISGLSYLLAQIRYFSANAQASERAWLLADSQHCLV